MYKIEMPLYKIQINTNSICLKVVSKESPLCNSFITIHQYYFQELSQGTNLDLEQAVSKRGDHHCKNTNQQTTHLITVVKIKLNWRGKKAYYFSNNLFYYYQQNFTDTIYYFSKLSSFFKYTYCLDILKKSYIF